MPADLPTGYQCSDRPVHSCTMHYFLALDFIAKLDDQTSKVSNYTGGEQVGTSWTDKVMTFKGEQQAGEEEGGDNDDEWVRFECSFSIPD